MGRVMRWILAFASARFRAVVFVSAIWLTIGWLMGYLRPLDASLGVKLPAWVQVPGIVAVAAGAALVLTCGVLLSTYCLETANGEETARRRRLDTILAMLAKGQKFHG
jgi:hypothetical protein